jgi:CheY-like chemotaxis protein/HPt (histidine-containing phosphotransfer) domain-containing protein
LRFEHGENQPKLVLLTSAGRNGDGAQARAAGFSGYLAKPARRDQLRGVLAAALGLKAGADMITRHRLIESGALFQGRVLLAEDNEVNQMVAVSVLEKLGLSVTVAANGLEAVDLWGAQAFDLILMDLHMPDMDGLEATALIRAAEREAGLHIPIIALTASVMQETRDQCTAAGMDAFLSKPFERKELIKLLRQFLGDPYATQAGEEPETVSEDASALRSAAVDQTILEELRSAMEEDFPAIIDAYYEGTEAVLHEIRAADGNAAALYRPAHTLKSSSANLGAMKLSELATDLEAHARSGQVPDAAARIDEIEVEFVRVKAALFFLTRAAATGEASGSR